MAPVIAGNASRDKRRAAIEALTRIIHEPFCSQTVNKMPLSITERAGSPRTRRHSEQFVSSDTNSRCSTVMEGPRHRSSSSSSSAIAYRQRLLSFMQHRTQQKTASADMTQETPFSNSSAGTQNHGSNRILQASSKGRQACCGQHDDPDNICASSNEPYSSAFGNENDKLNGSGFNEPVVCSNIGLVSRPYRRRALFTRKFAASVGLRAIITSDDDDDGTASGSVARDDLPRDPSNFADERSPMTSTFINSSLATGLEENDRRSHDVQRTQGKEHFHSYLYQGFRPLRWWGLLSGLHPFLEKEDDHNGTLDIRFKWKSYPVYYAVLLLVISILVMFYNGLAFPAGRCDPATKPGTFLTWTAFDQYVAAAAQAQLTTPSAFVFIVCFLLSARKTEKLFSDWKTFEARYPRIQAAMQNYAYVAFCLLVATMGVLGAIIGTTSAVILAHRRDPCNLPLFDAILSVASVSLRIWTSTYMELSLIYFAMGIRAAFGALGTEIAEEISGETKFIESTASGKQTWHSFNSCIPCSSSISSQHQHDFLHYSSSNQQSFTLLQHQQSLSTQAPFADANKDRHFQVKLAECRMCYLELAEFVELVSSCYTPQLLLALITLTLYCVIDLYLALIHLLVADDLMLTATYLGFFAHICARLLILGCVGHSMTAQACHIKRALQELDSSSWPPRAKKELDKFVFTVISVGKPVISACGFCSLGRPLCSSVFSQVMTCIVILIQFRTDKIPTG